MIRKLALGILLIITCLGIQLCQYPALIFTRRIYKWYIIQTQKGFASLILIITWIFCPISIVLSGDYNSLNKKSAILMANHQIYTDWWYIWILASEYGLGGNLKIILKDELRNIPLFGWGMQFFEFIFLKRKWNLDKDVLLKSLDKSKSDGSNLWLLVFPGNICKSNRKKELI